MCPRRRASALNQFASLSFPADLTDLTASQFAASGSIAASAARSFISLFVPPQILRRAPPPIEPQ